MRALFGPKYIWFKILLTLKREIFRLTGPPSRWLPKLFDGGHNMADRRLLLRKKTFFFGKNS
jgi:hypothetical protein